MNKRIIFPAVLIALGLLLIVQPELLAIKKEVRHISITPGKTVTVTGSVKALGNWEIVRLIPKQGISPSGDIKANWISPQIGEVYRKGESIPVKVEITNRGHQVEAVSVSIYVGSPGSSSDSGGSSSPPEQEETPPAEEPENYATEEVPAETDSGESATVTVVDTSQPKSPFQQMIGAAMAFAGSVLLLLEIRRKR